MYKVPDGLAEVADGAADGLAHPPSRVRAELEALAVVVLLHAARQACHALRNQVGQLHALVLVLEGDAHHQALIAGQHLGASLW